MQRPSRDPPGAAGDSRRASRYVARAAAAIIGVTVAAAVTVAAHGWAFGHVIESRAVRNAARQVQVRALELQTLPRDPSGRDGRETSGPGGPSTRALAESFDSLKIRIGERGAVSSPFVTIVAAMDELNRLAAARNAPGTALPAGAREAATLGSIRLAAADIFVRETERQELWLGRLSWIDTAGSTLVLSGLVILAVMLVSVARRLDAQSRIVREQIQLMDSQRAELGGAAADADRARLVAAEEARERMALEEQLRQSQKLEAVGRLAGGVAHDFNNLLTVARTYCDLLIEEIPEGDSKRADLLEIRAATERAGALSRRLLAFGRKQVFAPRVVSLSDVVESLQSMFVRTLPPSVSLRVQLGRELRPIFGDVGQLEQVIMNLVLNAVDAMPDGGTVTIATAPGAPRSTEPAVAHERPAYVRLTVQDTGTGMAPETRQHAFEPFFTTKGPGKGTGLGLATVYGIVEQHGGSIRIDSDLGIGTTFTIMLPCAPDGAEPTPPAPPPGRPGSRRPLTATVLVVDADPQLVASLNRLLATRGYHVVGAHTADDALAIARGHPGPIHALAVNIPMAGNAAGVFLESFAGLRPTTGILAMCGEPTDEVRRLIEQRSLAHVQKPFSADELAESLESLLARRRSSPAVAVGD